MLFSSLVFLIFFLPLTLAGYFLVPWKWKNAFLLLASLLFYGWSNPPYLILLLAEILIGFGSGLLLEKTSRQKGKWILVCSVLIYTGIFVYFKYTDFFIANLNAVFGSSIPLLRIVLPAGISFYTFQIISYNADIWNRKEKALHSFIDFAMYISLFCQLIAGPIVRYSDIAPDLAGRKLSLVQASDGFSRFVCGLCKKILIANPLFALSESWRTCADPSVAFAWMNAAAITLYIYFDFSGYSDMAIGLGKMLGFHFPENFNYPLTALTITDFWRRWHMSLTSWFRDYVYIPLGGSRVSRWKVIRNLFVVWLFTGMWHGATWNFILWGMGFFVILVLEKFVLNKMRIPTWLTRMVTIPVLLMSFLLFSDENLTVFASDLQALWGFGGLPFLTPLSWYLIRSNLVLLCIAILGNSKTPKKLYEQLVHKEWCSWIPAVLPAVGLFLCLAELTAGNFNPFLYFRF